jgi:ribosomal peptide maturation radical SAM protein 1
MPFASLGPSIQLGLLKAVAERSAYKADAYHLSLDLAQIMGTECYEILCEHRGVLLGEWLFSQVAFPDGLPVESQKFLTRFHEDIEDILEELRKPFTWLETLRQTTIPAYLDALMRTIDWSKYKVVGFSSTFQQNNSSFALARYIKERFPDVLIVFGGANFDGEMGRAWLSAIGWIDYVVVGEGDVTFPKLLEAIFHAQPIEIPGVLARNQPELAVRADPIVDLDLLPFPSFADYFTREAVLFPGEAPYRVIPFESSRGCWWGEKHHCVFCGLNGVTMKYRRKSPLKVVEELDFQAAKFGVREFEAVDNILDFKAWDGLLPLLSEKNYRLFFEVKSGLAREKIKALKAAGVASIQPGIESLSTALLRLMKKGGNSLQQINLLRWARFYDIFVSWNILHGIPGESLADYDEQARLVPMLRHLQPPISFARIWIERFSPIFSAEDDVEGDSFVPEPSHKFVYPATVDLEEAAYFFTGRPSRTLDDAQLSNLSQSVSSWKSAWSDRASTPEFEFSLRGGTLHLEDRRTPTEPIVTKIEGAQKAIMVTVCERPVSLEQLAQFTGLPVHDLSIEVGEMCRRGWVIKEANVVLGLPLPSRSR